MPGGNVFGRGGRVALGYRLRLRSSLTFVVLLTVAFMWLAAGVARGSTTATFDDLPAGATVGDQYRNLGGADRGVVFGPSPSGLGSEQPVVTVVGSSAHSGSQIGQYPTPQCPTGESCRTPGGFLFFPAETSLVKMFVGAFGTIPDTITLTAFDQNGVQIDSPQSADVIGGAGFSTPVSFSNPSRPISYVKVRGSTLAPIGIDDVMFDHPVLRADRLDVFQAVQPFGGLPAGHKRVYNGVILVAHKRTLVRFYVDALGATPAAVALHDATLRGFRAGTELPGSPLYPLERPVLTGGHRPGGVPAAQRGDPTGAFSFILPDSWEGGTITLVGNIASGVVPVPGTNVECSGPDCTSTLVGVRFVPTRRYEINPIELQVPGLFADPPQPQVVFAAAAEVGPFADQEFIVPPYQAIVDVTADVTAPRDSQHPCGLPPGTSVHDFNCEGLMVANAWDQTHNQPNDATITVVAAGQGGVASGVPGRTAHVDSDHPLTIVAHELGHLYGRSHASTACGATGSQQGEPWPPDQFGYLQGIGFDTFPGSAAAASQPGLFRAIFGRPPPGSAFCDAPPFDCGNPMPSDHFDFMSYCAMDNSTWISPKGWTESVCDLNPGVPECLATPQQASDAAAAKPGAPGQLLVTAVEEGKVGTFITDIQRGDGLRLEPGGTSSLRLIAKDGKGRVLSSSPLLFEAGHTDPGGEDPGREAFVVLQGFVPGFGTDSVAIADGSDILATRTRPPDKPRLLLLAPRGGETVGLDGVVAIRWSATDADKRALRITISYSATNGPRFHMIYSGPNLGSVRLPSRLLSASSHARVEIEASDGFNLTDATSKPFHALGAPPDVTITTLPPGYSQPNDAALLLEGSAFDDAGQPLVGDHLRWFDGMHLLGTGGSLSVAGLPAGAHTIRLVATDGAGRQAGATARVRLTQAPPSFVAVQAPEQLPSSARLLTITVIASIPCRLLVAGSGTQRTVLTLAERTPTQIAVRVSPGLSTLTLALELSAGSFRTAETIVIKRFSRRIPAPLAHRGVESDWWQLRPVGIQPILADEKPLSPRRGLRRS